MQRTRCGVSVIALGASVPDAPPDPPLSSAVANVLALFSAAIGGAATTGGTAESRGTASPKVDPEVGHPESVVGISNSESHGIEVWGLGECRDTGRGSGASSRGGEGFGEEGRDGGDDGRCLELKRQLYSSVVRV